VCFLSLYLSLYQFLDLFLHFCEIQKANNDIKGGIDAILYNPVVSNIPKWQTSDMDVNFAPVKLGRRNFVWL
jgi:hypothetical protein